MFTGIIDHCGVVKRVQSEQSGMRLSMQTDFADIKLGESIAIDGICLTVTDCEAQVCSFDISPETLKLTTASSFTKGKLVNLERALLPTDRLGGHFVMGHVDGLATLQGRVEKGDYIEFQFTVLVPELMKFMTKKGCIAVNGVSLTINEVYDDGFTVMLIPHSLQRTNLGQVEDKVNIEIDYLARIVIGEVI